MRQRRLWRRTQVLAAIALGGALGAQARYGMEHALPYGGGMPWGTLSVNAAGCLLIGIVMAMLLELTAPHRLLRPFVGVGMLGGFTTYSGYAVGIRMLLDDGRPWLAATYLALTPALAILLVWAGTRGTRRVMSRRRRGDHR